MDRSFLLTQGKLNIPCKLTVPDNCPLRRVVLGVHGLCGSATDPIQTALAEEMGFFESASLRFDFPAHGDSPMESDAFTVANCVDSLCAVAQYAREQFPQVEDLCVFATGFGAYITLLALPTLEAQPGNLRLVIQTPSVLMHDTLLKMLRISKETLRAQQKAVIPVKRPLTITYEFYKELLGNIALTTHNVPMLVLHSEEDAYIDMNDIRRFRVVNDLSKLVIIPGTSHQFLEDGAWDMVLDLTRDWFEFEQVLLTDYE